MSQPTPPLFSHYVRSEPLNPKDFIDITPMAKQAGFYFPHTGISQHAYFQAIDVSDAMVICSKDDLTRQLLKLAWRAARKVPTQSQVVFTVCQPPSQHNLYVNRSLDLVASIEHNKQGQPMLIITTKEEVMATSQD
ncbi:hypothetical protein [Vibrio jasicida]|uniref:hypothetical protein n=1 Tax=Vibrio jasicida TaxID=766224 RepID=UPI000CE2C653|nr:hypothetical protein [Vibrio jasicida]